MYQLHVIYPINGYLPAHFPCLLNQTAESNSRNIQHFDCNETIFNFPFWTDMLTAVNKLLKCPDIRLEIIVDRL